MDADAKRTLIANIEKLPMEEQEKVRAFVHHLLEDAGEEESEPRYLNQDWAGALRDLKENYTSLELEEEIMKRWTESARD